MGSNPPPVGGLWTGDVISIHIPVWGATRATGAPIWYARNFNPHPRVGSNSPGCYRIPYTQYFNPHPRVGSNSPGCYRIPYTQYFNPHPRVGSNSSLYNRLAIIGISIHIPVWGATSGSPCRCRTHAPPCTPISIHIPVWGATIAARRNPRGPGYFNPHPRVGSNCRRGAAAQAGPYFNPHPRVGSNGKTEQESIQILPKNITDFTNLLCDPLQHNLFCPNLQCHLTKIRAPTHQKIMCTKGWRTKC